MRTNSECDNKFYYSPSDYSPEYYLEVDDNWNLVKIISIASTEHELPEHKSIPVTENHYDYFTKNGGWEKFIKHMKYIGFKN